ncbi:polyphenol oxidase family protein [Salsipaludibacter albus]|uniref:polyphenol oxidase family protein n=1 Tax=Salsipaludibacter albus TaxID=2849650 RepID=UPI001EE43F0F|nr:polyphenol oxidase family protein [Salsipaludibacter albus]MBY5163211.1 polyphenol oxidase family protein [Salsipaludibacter albus]
MTLALDPVDLGPGVRAVFTGRDLDGPDEAVGAAGNLSHRRPHRPGRLAADRGAAAAAIGVDDDQVVRLRQVHGSDVVVVDDTTPAGAEVGPADGAVTIVPGRALAVLVADCVPVLVAGERAVGVAHAGRLGVVADVVGAVAEVVDDLDGGTVRAAIGPSIRGCCYEVEDWLRDEVASAHPAAAASTTWGTPSLDLPAAVRARLDELGIEVTDEGVCTHHDVGWFSHRRDPAAGRQAGMVVRTA